MYLPKRDDSRRLPYPLLIELVTAILQEHRKPIPIYVLDYELSRKVGFFVSIDQLREAVKSSDRFRLIDKDRVALNKFWRRCEECRSKNGVIWLEVDGVHLFYCLDCACKLIRSLKSGRIS